MIPFSRAIKAIRSSKTLGQLEVAYKYGMLTLKSVHIAYIIPNGITLLEEWEKRYDELSTDFLGLNESGEQ